MARTLRQSWLDEMGRAERAEAQLRQAQKERKLYWEAYQRAVVVVRALRGCRNAARVERAKAIKRAEAAEGLLEAAWLHSGHPHFQTWYESLTPAQRGEGDA